MVEGAELYDPQRRLSDDEKAIAEGNHRQRQARQAAYEAGLGAGSHDNPMPSFVRRHMHWFNLGLEGARRAPGLYWLRTEEGPIVGEWSGKEWLFIGDPLTTSGMFYSDKDIIGPCVIPSGV
jgi:hypothetical protein